MAITSSEQQHPVSGAVAAMRRLVSGLVDTSLYSMSPTEAAEALTQLAALTASLAELQLRVAAHADAVEVGVDTGATSTANWWAHETHQDRGDAARRMRLAHALGDGRSKVREALAAGEISEESAGIVVRALEALPEDLDPVTARRAEVVMVQHAQELAPRQLRLAGKALLAVVAPDVADAHEEKLLDAEERRARQQMRLTMWDDGHGTTHGSFALPTLNAAMLRKMLMAFAAPKHQRAEAAKRRKGAEVADEPAGGGAGSSAGSGAGAESGVAGAAGAGSPEEDELPPWRQPTPQRMGQALCELIERFSAGDLPSAGGMAATVVVTMTLEQLQGGVGAAQLDTGDRVSAGQARRLACQAGIIPLVLGGESVPLDVGRRRRLHDRYQRLVIQRRDQTCTAVGCDVPGWLCQFHHDEPWSQGGGTSVKKGRMLCSRHHHLVHDPAFDVILRPDGQLELRRRS